MNDPRPSILIIDDEEELRSAWARILSASGYPVRAAATAEAGAKIALSNPPDIILLDTVLPDQDGVELCISLRRELLSAEPLIAIISGIKLGENDRIRALDGGADEVFAKPVGSKELLSRVHALERLGEERRRLKKESVDLECLLKAAHNRIANDLATVENLLRMRAEISPTKVDAYTLEDLADRVGAISELHARLRVGTSRNCVEVADYLGGIMTNIDRYAGARDQSVDLRWTVERGLYMGDADAATLGMLVTELIGNALRHAFPDGRRGTVELRLDSSTEYLILSVRDDGVGLPGDFSIERTSVLGLGLVKALASRLGGELILRESQGTWWELHLDPGCLVREEDEGKE